MGDKGPAVRLNYVGLPVVDVLDVDVVAAPFSVVIERVAEVLAAEEREALYLCPSGVHGVIEAQDDDEFRGILNRAAFNVADGMPLVRCAQFGGVAEAERAFGPDVMLAVLERTAGTGVRHFFYGGREGVADTLAERMRERFPGLEVVGTYCPPFRPLTDDEQREVIARIHDCGADAVWVGLSTPKQERWIDAFRDDLPVKMLFSVGAAFDYHTGSITSAPEWMKRASLEWLFRLVQEPRRLWRRYAEIVPRFLWLLFWNKLGLRRRRAPSSDAESTGSSAAA